MEIFSVQLLYLLRAMLNAQLVNWGLLGFNFFELIAILLFLALAAAFSLKALHKNRHPVSAVEIWAVVLIGWITISYILHAEVSSISQYAKFIIPLMTYILLKRILPDRSAHVRMIFLMLIGFLLPFFMSAIMTYQGEGVGHVVYWTGLERYQGVYSDVHMMGHNAALAIMVTVVYVALRKCQKVPLGWVELILMATVFILGLYLLYASQVRNAYVGLFVFFVVVFYFYDKRILAYFFVLSAAVILLYWSQVSIIFYDFLDPPNVSSDVEAIGSGRKTMWTWALERWHQAPLLYQLTGMGNVPGEFAMTRPRFGTLVDGTIRPWADPHNDWLYVLLSLGLIGLAIFAGLFASILRAILSVTGKQKFALLGLFLAVMMMSGMSNSYLTRFTLFQMFFMLMVYVDLRSTDVSETA
ncbi:MAG: O-antigen ligase family protein [Pirellulaceae bacterium]